MENYLFVDDLFSYTSSKACTTFERKNKVKKTQKMFQQNKNYQMEREIDRNR